MTNCFQLILSSILQTLQTTFAQCVRLFLIFEGTPGIILMSPYWKTRWEIKKMLRARALKKKRKEEAIAMELERKRALEEAAAAKLRAILEEEERQAAELENERERELNEAKKLVSIQKRTLFRKM